MADKRKGWVLLYRSIRDSWIWDYKPFDMARAWIDLLLDANHEDAKIFVNGRLISIKRGQKWTSLRVLADRWGWRQEKVLRFLRALEQDGMITRKVSRSGTLLTIVKYGDFQDWRSVNGAQSGAKAERKRSETKNDKRMSKEGKKETSLSEGEKLQLEDEEDTSWFDSLEGEDVTAEH